MFVSKHGRVLTFICAVLAAACAAPTGPGAMTTGADRQPVARKTMTAVMMSTPAQLASGNLHVASTPTWQGGDELEELVNAGLTTADQNGRRLPLLAQAVPAVENGLWKVFPDGTMETTWKIRDRASWHDGTPFTSEDLIFTAALYQTDELPLVERPLRFTQAIEAPDAHTIVVKWKQTYIAADQLFHTVRPKHVMEKAFSEDKQEVLRLPYWTSEYVGTGAFKVRDWVDGSHIVLEAYDSYILGRPSIDQITVKFSPDPRAVAARILAGDVDLTLGRNLSLQEAMQVRETWREGAIEVGYENWIALFPQFMNPTPQAMQELPFRRALMHALDRQQLVDVLQFGMVPVAHTWVSPTEAAYREVEPGIVKYDFDPRRARQLIETLGFTAGPDGLLRDPGGQTLALEIRTSGGDNTHEGAIITAADDLRRVGIAAEPVILPDARRNDRAFQQTFPALRLWRNANNLWTLDRYHSTNAGTPENNFRQTSNYARYANPAFDALIDRYLVTINVQERTRLLGQIVQHQTEQLTVMGLFYNTEPHAVSNRLKNVTSKTTPDASHVWNVHQWELAS